MHVVGEEREESGRRWYRFRSSGRFSCLAHHGPCLRGIASMFASTSEGFACEKSVEVLTRPIGMACRDVTKLQVVHGKPLCKHLRLGFEQGRASEYPCDPSIHRERSDTSACRTAGFHLCQRQHALDAPSRSAYRKWYMPEDSRMSCASPSRKKVARATWRRTHPPFRRDAIAVGDMFSQSPAAMLRERRRPWLMVRFLMITHSPFPIGNR